MRKHLALCLKGTQLLNPKMLYFYVCFYLLKTPCFRVHSDVQINFIKNFSLYRKFHDFQPYSIRQLFSRLFLAIQSPIWKAMITLPINSFTYLNLNFIIYVSINMLYIFIYYPRISLISNNKSNIIFICYYLI